MKKFLFLIGTFLTLSIAVNAAPNVSGVQKMNLNAGGMAVAAGSAAVMRKLENEANQYLSNYAGDEDDDSDGYEGYDGYTGVNDDFLDFGGEPGNIMQAVEGHNFTITVTNAKNAARTIYFMPSSKNKTAAGGLTTGTMTEGTFAAIDDVAETNITAAGDQYGTIDFLRRFVETNPTYVKAFQIQSTTATGISQCKISVEEVSPFRQLAARILKPTMYQDQNMQQDKIINIPAGFDMNDQCMVKLTIAASTTLTITVICGAVLNGAKALQKKRTKAIRSKGSSRRK